MTASPLNTLPLSHPETLYKETMHSYTLPMSECWRFNAMSATRAIFMANIAYVMLIWARFILTTIPSSLPCGPQLGPSLAPVGPQLAPVGPQLGPSWPPVGPQLGPSWTPVGPILECCLGVGAAVDSQPIAMTADCSST